MNDKKQLIRGIMTGGVVKTTMRYATSKIVDAVATEIASNTADLSVVAPKGTLSIQYRELKTVDDLFSDKYEAGMLRFITNTDSERVFSMIKTNQP